MKEGVPYRRNMEQVVALFIDRLTAGDVRDVESFLESQTAEPSYSADECLQLIQAEISYNRQQGVVVDLNGYRQRMANSIHLATIDPDAIAELLLLPPPPPKRKPPFPSRYRPLVEIGRGGMGIVWRVHDNVLNRTLAAKVLRRNYQAIPHLNSRLEREAILTGALQHPGIPPVHDQGKLKDGSSFFAMKLVAGETLASMLKRDQRQDLSTLLGVFEQVAQTIAYAHSQSIIHRDLKPQNIMVGAFGEVQIMDWGMAKKLGDDAEPTSAPEGVSNAHLNSKTQGLEASAGTNPVLRSLTQMGDIFGTPGYMPPEQARGETEKMNAAADVYALGSILFEILTGHRLLEEVPLDSIVATAAKGDLQNSLVHLETNSLAAELKSLCRDCLQADPQARPQHGAEVADRIQRYLSSVEQRLQEAEVSQAKAEAIAQEERKRRRLSSLLTATIALGVVVGIGAWTWYQIDLKKRQQANLKTRAETVVQALGNTPATTVPFAIENLRPFGEMVLPMLEDAFEKSNNVSQKVNYALAIGSFGRPDIDFLVGELPNVEDEDLPLVLNTLGRDTQTSCRAIAELFEQTSDPFNRARLATSSLCLGDAALVKRLTSGSEEVDDRLSWIASHRRWQGETQPLMDLATDPACPSIERYAALLALGQVNFKRIPPAQKDEYEKALIKQFSAPVAATIRAGTEALMNRWGLPLPQYDPGAQPELKVPTSARNWYLNSIGQVMVRVSIEGRASKREIDIADRETTAAQFLQYATEDKAAGSRKLISRIPGRSQVNFTDYIQRELRFSQRLSRTNDSLSDIPMEGIGYYEILRFCNWMSRREGLRPCYRNLSPRSTQSTFALDQKEVWRQDWTANGYRLPTEEELAALVYQDSLDGRKPIMVADFDLQLEYAWISKNASESMQPATRYPDNYGLFDLLGNLEETSNFRVDSGRMLMTPKLRIQRKALGGSIQTQKLDTSIRSVYPYGTAGNVSVGIKDGFRIVRTAPDSFSDVAKFEVGQQVELFDGSASGKTAPDELRYDIANELNSLGIDLMDLDQPHQAQAVYRKVIKLSDQMIDRGFRVNDAKVTREGARINLGIAKKQAGDNAGALEATSRALKELSDVLKVKPPVAMARTYFSNGLRVNSRARLNLITDELTRLEKDALNEDVAQLRYAKMLSEAETLIARVGDDDWQNNLLMAKLHAKNNQFPEAVEWIKKAIRSSKSSPSSASALDEMKQLEADFARKAGPSKDDF